MKSFGMPKKKKRVSSISKRRSTECSWQNSHGRSWQARLQQKAEQPPGYLEIYQHASKDLKQQGGQDWLTLNRFSAISGYFGLLLETSSSVYQPPESPRVVQSPLQTVRPSFSIFSCTRAWPSLLDDFIKRSSSTSYLLQVQVQASCLQVIRTSELLIGSCGSVDYKNKGMFEEKH